MAVTQTGRGISTGTDSSAKDEIFRAAFFNYSAQDGLTATPGGAAAGISISGYQVSRFTAVATTNDSCRLGAALPGRFRVVINAGANTLAVFPASGEVINALAVDTAFAVATNKTAIFFCAVAGTWNSVLTA